MGKGLKITIGDEEFAFDHEETQNLCKCSEFVHSQVEQEIELNGEDGEEEGGDLEIPIDVPNFGKAEVKKAVEYLRHHKYSPPVYGKVQTSLFTLGAQQ